MGLYVNDCAFNGDTVAESRFEIVNLHDSLEETRLGGIDTIFDLDLDWSAAWGQ